MEDWTVNRVFAVRTYFETKSTVQKQIRFRHEFDVPRYGRIPSRNAILKWVDDFNVHGTVVNKFVGPAYSIRTPENVERMKAVMQQSTMRSARRHVIALQMSSRSLRRILHEDLRFHPYQIHITHELKEHDKAARVNFRRQFLDIVKNDEGVLDDLIISDEAHFHLSGYVNKQNFRYWSDNNPLQLRTKPLHSEKVTIWCGVSTFAVIGPYFFEENNQAISMDSERYCTRLQTFLATEPRRMRQMVRNV
jgi:hypothetical protein